MDRNTVVVHRYGGQAKLGELLDMYGHHFVAENFGYNSIFLFDVDTSRLRSNCVQGVVRGRHPSHYTKHGKVKHFYKNRNVKMSLVHDLKRIAYKQCKQTVTSSIKIQRAFRRYSGRMAIALAIDVIKSNVEFGFLLG